jgi:DNA replication protein DnaC
MLTHPSYEKLQTLQLKGMLKALEEQQHTQDIDSLCFEERLGLLLDREMTERQTRRMRTRLKKAKLRHQAVVEDIDYRHPRGLDKSLVLSLSGCAWIKEHQNLIITGPTGIGKSWLACALAHKACREGYSALYTRLPRLLQDMGIARGDGRYPKLMKDLAKTDLLILDDWGLAPLGNEQRRDLLEILEDRHGLRSTLVTSQLPVESWHAYLDDPTLADAILDRLIHNAHRMNLRGESMRKKKAPLTTESGSH